MASSRRSSTRESGVHALGGEGDDGGIEGSRRAGRRRGGGVGRWCRRRGGGVVGFGDARERERAARATSEESRGRRRGRSRARNRHVGIGAHTARGRPATRRARTRAREGSRPRARQQSCPPPCSRRVRRRSTRTAPRVARRRVSDGRPAPSSVGLADVATKDLVIARGCPPGRNWISISCVADSDQSASRICAGSAPGTGLASRSTRDEEGVGCVARHSSWTHTRRGPLSFKPSGTSRWPP